MSFNAGSVLRTLRTVHGWLGILVLPWVIIIGMTGFYLNHSRTILNWVQGPAYNERTLLDWPGSKPVDEVEASLIASRYWSDVPFNEINAITYHDFPALQFRKTSGQVIVVKESGHYYVKTNYQRSTFAPDGTRVHHKYYWSSILGELHVRGWIGNTFGRWFADITALSMIVFGLSGMFLWWMPRSKRVKRFLGVSR